MKRFKDVRGQIVRCVLTVKPLGFKITLSLQA